jgi:hypothetical protein
MTQGPRRARWTILSTGPAAEMQHVFLGQPHQLEESSAWLRSQKAWGVSVQEQDFAPLRLEELPESILALTGVAAAVDTLSERVARLSSEVQAIRKEVADLTAQQEERPITTVATIHDLGKAGLTLTRPMQIVVEEYPEEVVARFPEVGASAAAESEFEAIELLKADIVSLYWDLVATPRKKLGRAPVRWLQVLSQVVRR